MLNWLTAWHPNAVAAGAGAFCGALGAYALACRKEKQRQNAEYLCLLLVVHAHLRAIYSTLTAVPDAAVKEIDGAQIVEFDLPLPDLPLSPSQMQTLMEVSPDKQMPSALIGLQHFLRAHSSRVTKSGANTLPLSLVKRQAKQLQFMLLSVRTQYEQGANDAFPLYESAHT